METREIIGNTTTTPNPQSDWGQIDKTKPDYIKNKPTILTETDVKEIIAETGGGGEGGTTIIVQADWAQTDSTKSDYIKNKPTILTEENVEDIIAETEKYATKEELEEAISGIESGDGVVLPEGTNILYGTDATGETWGYKIAQDIPGVESDSDSIINTMILSNALYTKQDVLEVGNNLDLSPTKDSMNPVTSGGVRAEFNAFSLAYDRIIENAKTESKDYTDTKITELSSSQEQFVGDRLSEFETYMDEKHASKDELNNAIQQAILDSWEEEV